MDFTLPEDLRDYLAELDEFIEREIKPLERQDDNIRFFDHRREDARTDWDRGGLPSREWEALLAEARAPGRRGRPLPVRVPEGVRRPGRHQPGHGGDPRAPGPQGPRPALRPAERARDRRQQRRPAADAALRQRRSRRRSGSTTSPRADGTSRSASPSPSTAATPPSWRPAATSDGEDWVINGEKTWNTGIHTASHDLIFARTSGDARASGTGITGVPGPGRTPPASRSRSTCGPSTCPPTTRHVSLHRRPGPGQRRSSAARAAACRSCSTSSTRTASGRPPPAWAPRSSASTARSSTRRPASRSASRWRATRPSSSRWSSCRPSARCCAR